MEMIFFLHFFLLFFLFPVVFCDFKSIWPTPRHIVNGTEIYYLSPSFIFTMCDHSKYFNSEILNPAFDRYRKIFFFNGPGINPYDHFPKDNIINEISFCISSEETPISLYNISEQYKIDIKLNSNTIEVNSETTIGAIRSLETISQLIDLNFLSNDDIRPSTTNSNFYYSINGVPITINDYPRFIHRGLLIDTSRHFFPIDILKKMIDAMSYSKFNLLHWHISDAESFPFDSQSYPKLIKTAYSPQSVYTTNDINSIVKYARLRGINILFEIDIPGHSSALGKYYDVTSHCPKISSGYRRDNNINLNPASKDVLTMIEELISELHSLGSVDYFHLGGDEVVYKCWLEDDRVVDWMSKYKYSTRDTFEYFVNASRKMVLKRNALPIWWQEVIERDINMISDVDIIELWKDDYTFINDLVTKGFKIIMGAGNYLDRQSPIEGSNRYQFVDTWIDFWLNDPTSSINDKKYYKNVYGGESIMFGEQIDEGTISTRIWPRACGTSERLWSTALEDYKNPDIQSARERLQVFSCRLTQRGIDSSPLYPGYCYKPSSTKSNRTKHNKRVLPIVISSVVTIAVYSLVLMIIYRKNILKYFKKDKSTNNYQQMN